jgi:hypothetical protein
VRTFSLFSPLVLGFLALTTAESAGQTFVITSKPRFEQRGLLVDLVIADTNQSFDISWGIALPRMQFIPVSLEYFARRDLLAGSESPIPIQPESNATFSFTAKNSLHFVNVPGGFTL